MTIQQNNQDIHESILKETQVENDLLLTQIHQIEEELEYYFKRNQELESQHQAGSLSNVTGGMVWVDEELPVAVAENQRLHALVEVLRKAHQLERNNALNVKLGNILIQGVDSPSTLFAVPGKIGKIWRESNCKRPPKVLGGQGFDKVIRAYNDGGFESVEKILTETSIIPSMQANAYTVLARQLMKNDRAAAVVAARNAYELDPKSFRMKWLAFRLHEVGDVIEAEAMLDVLPTDIPFSESEARQARQLRNEAKHVRQHEAKQNTRFLGRRAEFERQLTQHKVINDEEKELLVLQLHQAQEELESQYLKCQTLEQAQLTQVKVENEEGNELLLIQLHQVQDEIECQYLKCEKLEQEKAVQAGLKDELEKLAAERLTRIEQLTQAKAVVESEHGREIDDLKNAQVQDNEKNELFQSQVFQELESQYSKNELLEQEKSALADQNDEQEKLATERAVRIEELTQDRVTIESELGREIEALKQLQVHLEQEKEALVSQRNEQVQLATDRKSRVEELTQDRATVESELGREIVALKQSRALLEQEKEALVNQNDEQLKLATEREERLEQLTQDRAKLEQEMEALVSQNDEQLKLATEREERLEQLTQDRTTVESELGREIGTLTQAQAKLEQEMEALVSQNDEQLKLATEREERLEQLTQDRATVESELGREIGTLTQVQAQLEQEMEARAGQKDEQEKLVAQLNNELREARQAASLSLKLQMLREADLKDLQASYQASRAQEENQHQLLTKLGERLNTASVYFNKITIKETEGFLQEESNPQSARVTTQSADRSEGKL